jgi:8-oxo-dGTP pyrophosphatase MutT (NUDIX family)
VSERQFPQIAATGFPRIDSRTVVFDSPWVRIVNKDVVFELNGRSECHSVVECADWIAICPRTEDGRFIVVQSYRPTVEARLWEFPGGAIDPGETPEQAVKRELTEETGYGVVRLVPLGSHFTDYGRLSTRGHLFYGEVKPIENLAPERGSVVAAMTAEEIDRLFASGMTSFPQFVLWMLAKAVG